MPNITFRRLYESDFENFCNDVKRIFSIAVIEEFKEINNSD